MLLSYLPTAYHQLQVAQPPTQETHTDWSNFWSAFYHTNKNDTFSGHIRKPLFLFRIHTARESKTKGKLKKGNDHLSRSQVGIRATPIIKPQSWHSITPLLLNNYCLIVTGTYIDYEHMHFMRFAYNCHRSSSIKIGSKKLRYGQRCHWSSLFCHWSSLVARWFQCKDRRFHVYHGSDGRI